jgi:hypothetical protein
MVPVWWVSLVLGGGNEGRSATLHGAFAGAGGVRLCESTRGVVCLHGFSMLGHHGQHGCFFRRQYKSVRGGFVHGGSTL